jgi:L-alanine-DL-glutamate epimerase-like enolase superfamily enzyme
MFTMCKRWNPQGMETNVRWFEEPVSSDDLAGLHEVRPHG